MIKQDRFSRQEYSLESIPKEAGVPQRPPLGKKLDGRSSLQKPRGRGSSVERSIDSMANASVISKGSRLSELCEEDKNRIGVLIKRLAEETEQKRRAEEEVSKIKNMYQRDLEALHEQNRKLAENTKAIEQRYNQVAELAKKSLKPAPFIEEKITIQDEDGEMLPINRKEQTAYFLQANIPKPQSVIKKEANTRTDQARAHVEDSASDKTIPKKKPPVPKTSKLLGSKLKQNSGGSDDDEPRKSEHLLKTKAKDAKKPSPQQPAVSDDDEEPKKDPPMETPEPKNRFLLPRRDGESLDRLDKLSKPHIFTPRNPSNNHYTVDEDDEDDTLKTPITSVITRQEITKKKPEDWAAEAAKRERESELKRRSKQNKVTLGEILRLKVEVEEVTKTLRVGDEARRKEEERGQQLKKELEEKLQRQGYDHIQDSQTKNHEEYQKTLRSAYEESSSEEERQLERRIKANSKPLGLERYKPKALYQDEMQDLYSNNRSKANHQATHPRASPLNGNDSGMWGNSYIPQQHKLLDRPDAGWCDTSEEDEVQGGNPFFPRQRPASTKSAVQRQASHEKADRREAASIDLAGLTEEELILIGQMVDERINNTGHKSKSHKPPTKHTQSQVGRNQVQYDEGLFSLVYDMENGVGY